MATLISCFVFLASLPSTAQIPRRFPTDRRPPPLVKDEKGLRRQRWRMGRWWGGRRGSGWYWWRRCGSRRSREPTSTFRLIRRIWRRPWGYRRCSLTTWPPPPTSARLSAGPRASPSSTSRSLSSSSSLPPSASARTAPSGSSSPIASPSPTSRWVHFPFFFSINFWWIIYTSVILFFVFDSKLGTKLLFIKHWRG